MRFQVPQFIEVEDKIFGPLTLKQFIYLAGGGGLSFVVYTLLNSLLLAAIPMGIIMAISATFAFYKLNGRQPFVDVLENVFKYYFGSKLYVWKKENRKPSPAVPDASQADSPLAVPKVSDSRLRDLTWSLDIKESMYSHKTPQ